MKIFVKSLLLCLLTLVATSLFEKKSEAIFVNNKTNNIYVGTGLNILYGGYVEAGYYYKNFIGIRGEFAGLPQRVIKNPLNKLNGFVSGLISASDSVDMNFGIGIKSQTWGLDLSVRPLGGAWRIDVGFRYSDVAFYADIDASVKKSVFEKDLGSYAEGAIKSDFKINGRGTLRVSDTKKPALNLATGWDFNPGAGFIISFSVGVHYLFKPYDIIVDVNTSNIDDVVDFDKIAENIRNTNPGLDHEIEKKVEDKRTEVNNKVDEYIAKINSKSIKDKMNYDSLKKYFKFYPEIKLGIGYRFKF